MAKRIGNDNQVRLRDAQKAEAKRLKHEAQLVKDNNKVTKEYNKASQELLEQRRELKRLREQTNKIQQNGGQQCSPTEKSTAMAGFEMIIFCIVGLPIGLLILQQVVKNFIGVHISFGPLAMIIAGIALFGMCKFKWSTDKPQNNSNSKNRK